MQAAYAAAAALCVTDRAGDDTGVEHRPQPKPALTDFVLQLYSYT